MNLILVLLQRNANSPINKWLNEHPWQIYVNYSDRRWHGSMCIWRKQNSGWITTCSIAAIDPNTVCAKRRLRQRISRS